MTQIHSIHFSRLFETARFQSKKAWVAGFAAVVMALAASPALADPPGRVGRVAESYGSVWLADDQRGEWIAAHRNRPVTHGDRLSLQPGARVVVHIGSATLRLDGDSELEVLQMDDRVVRLHLHAGSAALQLPSGESAREFEISTVDGRVSALQRAHLRVDRRQNTSIITAWDGSLRFESNDSSLDVAQGQRAELWQENGRTHYSWGRIDRDEFTDWVVASERRDGPSVAQRYVSPEMTGAHDLNRYGEWDQHPQYGAVWYPRTVASDWAPYRDGQWTWVAPWGWTWVDNAPWGFAPFHYGRWVQWRGRWVWTPGQYVARPTYAPALVAWFGGPNLSVTISSDAHVGWVALAPFEVFSPWFVASAVYAGHINVSPWRNVRGYHTHRYNDYANRGHQGGFTVVPQRVLTERQPIRQDIITPRQAAVWRGGAVINNVPAVPPRGGAVVPGQTVRDGVRPNDRVAAVFVPPPVAPSRAVAPVQAPGATRAVPWVRSGQPGVAALPSGSARPDASGVVSAPAVTRRDGVVMSPDVPSREAQPSQPTAPRGSPIRVGERAAVLGGADSSGSAGASRSNDVITPRRMELPEQQAPRLQVPPPVQAAPAIEQRRMPPTTRDRDAAAVMSPVPPPVMQPQPRVIQSQPQPQPQVFQPPPQVMQPRQPQPQQQQQRPRGSKDDDDDRGPRRGSNNDRVK